MLRRHLFYWALLTRERVRQLQNFVCSLHVLVEIRRTRDYVTSCLSTCKAQLLLVAKVLHFNRPVWFAGACTTGGPDRDGWKGP